MLTPLSGRDGQSSSAEWLHQVSVTACVSVCSCGAVFKPPTCPNGFSVSHPLSLPPCGGVRSHPSGPGERTPSSQQKI